MQAEQLDRLKAALADRYVIERELGRGGMATVYLAEDLKHGRRVAIKVLTPELAAVVGPDRFLREIGIAAKLTHPHILPVYDSGEADGFLYYMMPYVAGESLRERLDREKQLPIDDAVQIAREVADALMSAHGRGVVHRDIKPENILLEEGHAVVADFGIARAISVAGGDRLTETGIAIGTPAYMSPEQAAGESHLDGRSDVYSLGCVLYELLAGQPPFTGPTAESVVHQHLHAEPRLVTEVRSAVRRDLAEVLRRALAKTLADRFATAEQFARALVRASQAAAAGEAAPRQRPGIVMRARALVAVSAVAILGVTWLLWQRSAPPVSVSTVAVLPFTVLGGSEVGYLGHGMVDLLSTKLDGAGVWRSADARATVGMAAREEIRTLDPERARRVAQRLGAGLYVMGNILEVGGRLRIDASLYDSERAALLTQASAEGPAVEIFALVDELAAQLLRAQAGGLGAQVTRIASVTTSSLPALRAYLEGESAFRRGHYESAFEAFRRATVADSEFALAYYRLSVAAEWLIREDVAEEAAELASRYADRLSDHDRQLLEAFVTWRRGHAAEAERRYRVIVGTYPEDLEAWYQLGEVLYHYNPLRGRPLEESREAFERVLAYESDHAASLVHLVRVAAREGRRAEVDSLADRILELNPKGSRVLEIRALRAFAFGDLAEQARVVREFHSVTDVAAILSIWTVGTVLYELEGAKRLADLLTHPQRAAETRALGYVWLAHVEAARGRFTAARQALASAEPLDPAVGPEYRALLGAMPFVPASATELRSVLATLERWDATKVPQQVSPTLFVRAHDGIHRQLRAYLLGLLSARLGDFSAAARHAAALEALGGPAEARNLARDLALGVRAQIAAAQDQPADALQLLTQARRESRYPYTLASPFYSQAYERYLQAKLLEQLGRTDEAVRWYSTLVGTSPNELVYLAPAQLAQARIYDRRGDVTKALEFYGKFADLWRDADPELQPIVRDVQGRMARLVGER